MKKKIFFAVFAVILLIFMQIPTYAVSMSDFGEEEGYTDEQKQQFWNATDLKLSDIPLENQLITCFDVSPSGLIAVGSIKSLGRRSVVIYDSEWNFIRRYDFDTMGSFYVFWDNEDIVLVLVRSDICLKVDENGECLDIIKFSPDFESSKLYRKLEENIRIVDGVTYKITNGSIILDFFDIPCHKLTLTDTDGNTKVLYGNSIVYIITILVGVIIVGAIIALTVFRIIHKYKKRRKKEQYEKIDSSSIS